MWSLFCDQKLAMIMVNKKSHTLWKEKFGYTHILFTNLGTIVLTLLIFYNKRDPCRSKVSNCTPTQWTKQKNVSNKE